MLSAQKFFAAAQYSSGRKYRIILQNNVTTRTYKEWVPQKLLIDEESRAKHKVDPRIKTLSRKLIYSDYIKKKCLTFGRKQNAMILSKLRVKAQIHRTKELMEKPAVSVALKYLREEKDEPAEGKESSENEKSSEAKKPIYMPYGAMENYSEVQDPEKKDVGEFPELNPEFVKKYENYLKDEDSVEAESLETSPNKDFTESMEKRLPNWMTDYEQYEEDLEDASPKTFYGTPNQRIPVSSVPCGGCGALLHCQDPAIPGYLPSELFTDQHKEILTSSICQRCHFIKNYKTLLDVNVSADQYPALLSHLKKKPVAIIFMVDLTDFPCSIWSGLMDIVSKTTQIYVVGNKVDLLPYDDKHFIANVQKSLRKALDEMGIGSANIKSINLISAKTGYGVEELINKLTKIWSNKGDVYLIGCTNVGKSSLFNALLRSDYCKIEAADLIQRATVSPWPGTTLNLLKFPILNPIRVRQWVRFQRLRAERETMHEMAETRSERFKDTKRLRDATLQGYIGQTFSTTVLVEGRGYFGQNLLESTRQTGRLGIDETQPLYKNSRWFYDTPGAILPDQILHLLTTEELMLTLPRSMISPRSFILYKSQSLFIAGLGRLDFIDGAKSIICTVFASKALPINICKLCHAEEIYKKLLQSEAFVVPVNDPERLKLFPALESKTFEIPGASERGSSADVVLSNAGWIAVTTAEDNLLTVKAWTPQGKGIHLRTPALLRQSVNLRGYLIPNSQAFTSGKRIYVKK